MRTNKEKWEAYQIELKRGDDAFMAQELPVVPTIIFEVLPCGQISELPVEYAGYRHLPAIGCSNKKPTRKNLAEIAAYLDSLVRKRDEILLFWRKDNSCGARSLEDVREGTSIYMSKQEAQTRCQTNKAKAQHEDKLLKNGHFRCEYCGKVTPDGEVVLATIYAAQYPGGKKQFKHCSGKCAMNNQFAHEG